MPKRKPLVTLRDAGAFITALPAKTHAEPAWQTAMDCLLLAADKGGPGEFARLGMVKALSPKPPRVAPGKPAAPCRGSNQHHRPARLLKSHGLTLQGKTIKTQQNQMLRGTLVRSEGVELYSVFNGLPQSAGNPRPLTQKRNFRRPPHLLAADRAI
ncbi:hypothetical protein FNL55_12830 [Tardiphaga sp. vice352]|uniref:hypothetical protein n=1 Tax=Tardiphaga sp. vice352 TaxID=2592816 RepID=UPI001164D42A|nr:hypothetical protein [Tardiphaga sp. vice352]QDM32124.1 hypothetical protein FNL55_12830 [Tardiphaga sp. vice352]